MNKPEGVIIKRRLEFSGFPTYRIYLKSAVWKKTVEKCLWRADGKCEWCKRNSKRLQVHHLTYQRLGRELSSDVMALCPGCHLKIHSVPKEMA